MIGAPSEFGQSFLVTFFTKFGTIIQQEGRRTAMYAVALAAVHLLIGVHVKAEIVHALMRLVALGTNLNRIQARQFGGIGNVFHRWIFSVDFAAFMATYATYLDSGTFGVGAQPVGGFRQAQIVFVVARQTGFIIGIKC
jgi:hypothetical protein